MTTLTKTLTVADYDRVFEAERAREYPVVDAFEARMGFAVDRQRLEQAARVLACPVKNNPPNWQHGRVLYAAARKRIAGMSPGGLTILDIGTAKGFSALCLQWAVNDEAGALVGGAVTSTDVIDPDARVRRNTVAEVDGLLTLRETLASWPEAQGIRFLHGTGIDALEQMGNIEVAFVDGKHTGAVVAQECRLLAEHQEPGAVAIFDDVHLEDVGRAVKGLSAIYALETLALLPNRAYAVGVRRG